MTDTMKIAKVRNVASHERMIAAKSAIENDFIEATGTALSIKIGRSDQLRYARAVFNVDVSLVDENGGRGFQIAEFVDHTMEEVNFMLKGMRTILEAASAVMVVTDTNDITDTNDEEEEDQNMDHVGDDTVYDMAA